MNINLLEQENLANLVSAGEIDDHTETVSHRKNKINLKPFVRWIVYVITLLLPMFFEEKLSVYKYLDLSKLVFILGIFLVILVNWWLVWLVTIISCASWMLMTVSRNNKMRMSLLVAPMLIIVLGVFFMLIRFSIPSFTAKLPVEVSPSHKTSFAITMETLRESPLYGYGQGNFKLAYEKYRPKSIANTIFSNTKFNQSASALFDIVIGGGIITLLAFAFLLFSVARLIYKIRSSSVYLTLASVGLFFIFPFNIVLMFLLFFSFILLEFANHSSSEHILELEDSARYSFMSSVVFIAGLVTVLIGYYFGITRYIGDIKYVNAFKETSPGKSFEAVTGAIALDGHDAKYYRFLSQILLVRLRDEFNNKDIKISQDEKSRRLGEFATSSVDAAVKATNINPNDYENWLNRGVIYKNLLGLVDGADKNSIAMFEEALKRSPTDPNLYYQIASTYLVSAENNRLIINNLSETERAKLSIANIKTFINDNLAKAEENYKKSIDLNNNFGQAIYDLGLVYERQSKLSDAVKQFEKLRAGNPQDAGLAFTLGLLYYRNNQKDAALVQWQQAVALFPDYSNAHWYLSLIYEERGQMDRALMEVEKIIVLNPDSQQVQQRLEQLRVGTRIIPPGKLLNQKPL